MSTRIPWSRLAWVPLVVLALAAIYLPGLGNALVFDDAYLTEGLYGEYRNPAEVRARWLSYGSFVWVTALLGEGWWKQRLVNLLLHAGTVAALWGLYRELLRHIAVEKDPLSHEEPVALRDAPALGLAIGFFALNPVAVYAVAYLIQRSIVMATLFVALALLCFCRGLRLQRFGWLAGAVAFYVLAVAAKEYAIFTPLAAVPLYVLVTRPSGKRLAVLGAAGAVMAGVVAAILWQRYGEIIGKPFDEFSRVYLAQLAALDAQAPANAWPLSIVNQCWLFFEYGLRWMVPYTGWMSINLRPPFPTSFLTFPQVLGVAGYLGVIAGGAVLLWRYRDWRALLGVSLMLPALLFATEFLTVWVQDPFVLYRSYLWAIGLPGLVMCVVAGASGRATAIVGVALAILLGWGSVDRVMSLETPLHAWSDAIAKLGDNPRSVGRWMPYVNRGNTYVDRDEFALALLDYERASQLGDMGLGAFNKGTVLATQGKHAQALESFDLAAKQGYDLYNLPVQRGLSLLAVGRLPEALAQFQAARAMSPPSPTKELVALNLAKLYLQTQQADKAVPEIEPLAADPKNREARYLLGLALVMRNDHARAHEVLSRLLAEERSGPASYARAMANYGLKRKAEALADIDEAVKRDPANAHLKDWQAKIRALPGPP